LPNFGDAQFKRATILSRDNGTGEAVLKVFVSYASEKYDIAVRVASAIRERGHKVFFDRTDLPEGGSYHDRIAKAVEESHAIVFLVSPESVEEKRYTLTELLYAERKWPSANGRVLPVMIAPTDLKIVPEYLKSVNILTPRGDVAAEAAFALDRMRRSLPNLAGRVAGALALPVGFVTTLALGVFLGVTQISPRLETEEGKNIELSEAAYRAVDVGNIASLRKYITDWKNAPPVDAARDHLLKIEQNMLVACGAAQSDHEIKENASDHQRTAFGTLTGRENEQACLTYLAAFDENTTREPRHYWQAKDILVALEEKRKEDAQQFFAALEVLRILQIDSGMIEGDVRAALPLEPNTKITAQVLSKLKNTDLKRFRFQAESAALAAIRQQVDTGRLKKVLTEIPPNLRYIGEIRQAIQQAERERAPL
jgi:hypothetical protein